LFRSCPPSAVSSFILSSCPGAGPPRELLRYSVTIFFFRWTGLDCHLFCMASTLPPNLLTRRAFLEQVFHEGFPPLAGILLGRPDAFSFFPQTLIFGEFPPRFPTCQTLPFRQRGRLEVPAHSCVVLSPHVAPEIPTTSALNDSFQRSHCVRSRTL